LAGFNIVGVDTVTLYQLLHIVSRLKNEWSYTSTPQYDFMPWCSVKRSTGTTLPLLIVYIASNGKMTVNAGVGSALKEVAVAYFKELS
jgi:hypothetical protein